MQNRIRSVLTAIIPPLLQPVHPEQKKIVIQQMIAMVEKVILEKYSLDAEYDTSTCSPEQCTDKQCVTDVCANVMNSLGGHFIVEKGKDENTGVVKGDVCPWGIEEARANPILCNLTRGIFSRLASKSNTNLNVEVLKTMGNRDECCLFEFR